MGKLRGIFGLWIVCVALWSATTQAQMFAPAGTRVGRMTATAVAAQSKNSLYEVSIEDTGLLPAGSAEATQTLVVSKRNGNGREILWSTTFKGWSVRFLRPSEVFVSDEGDFVVVGSSRGQVVIHRKEKSFELERGSFAVGGLFPSPADDIFRADELDGEKIVRIWDRDKNDWRVYRTTDGSRITVMQRPEVTAKWNESARREILERLALAKREALRRSVAQKSVPLARMAATAMGQSTNVMVSETDYEFLTLLRNPDDRKWIEQLMQPGGATPSGFWHTFGRYDPYEYTVTDVVYSRADWLLGIWDHKVKPGMIQRGMMSSVDDTLPRFNLGKLTGKIVFPGPINFDTGLHKPALSSGAAPSIHLKLLAVDRPLVGGADDQENVERP